MNWMEAVGKLLRTLFQFLKPQDLPVADYSGELDAHRVPRSESKRRSCDPRQLQGCSKSGLHSFTYDIPYECFPHEQLCTEIQTEASAELAIRGLHSRLNSLNIRLDNHKRAIITIEKCLNTINPRRRATALWACNTRRKAIAHLEARIQHDHRYLAIKHGIFAESRAAIIRIQNSIDKSEREQDPIDRELWQEEIAERFHEKSMDKIRQADEGAYETEERLTRSRHEGAASAASPMPFEQVLGTAQEDVQYRGMAGMVGLSLVQYTEEAAIKVEEEDFNAVAPWTTLIRPKYDALSAGSTDEWRQIQTTSAINSRTGSARMMAQAAHPSGPQRSSSTRLPRHHPYTTPRHRAI
ncbi:hypothetical protein CGCSCA4_v014743 [Colletotrichum siamense]|uniref:Uncharacterized protein n=1 Tax=Colletotrichum siamense TaxID=690259 RepID=A0A9P5EHI2_COLSI|nr:hypothetical protein CGCSCA4_v014743 [Colletotrichum siamense]KAF4841244.1 hypothetical protein CGCSCA2_v014900 [Colletotrichum siamense]